MAVEDDRDELDDLLDELIDTLEPAEREAFLAERQHRLEAQHTYTCDGCGGFAWGLSNNAEEMDASSHPMGCEGRTYTHAENCNCQTVPEDF